MGMAPTLWVFDASALPEVDTRQISELQQVFPLLDRLYSQVSTAPKPSVRLKRLVDLLGRRFPDATTDGNSAEASVWEEGIAPLSEAIRSPIWAVPLASEARERLLPDLVSWARELMLDVYDDELGIYVPADGLPVPYDRGVKFMRVFFDKEARRPWPNAMALRQAVIHGLTLVLAPAGFVFAPREGDDACFARTVADGVQRVTALVSGTHPALHCRVFVEHHSQSVCRGLALVDGKRLREAPDSYKQFALLGRQFDLLRMERRSDWCDDLMGWPWLTFCPTPFWLGWVLEDLEVLGLRLLNDMSTTEGLVNVLGGRDYKWCSQNINGESSPADRIRNLVSLGAAYLSAGLHQECVTLLNEHQDVLSLGAKSQGSDAEVLRRMALFCRREHV